MKKLDKLPLSSVGSKMYGLEVFSLFVTLNSLLTLRKMWMAWRVASGKLRTFVNYAWLITFLEPWDFLSLSKETRMMTRPKNLTNHFCLPCWHIKTNNFNTVLLCKILACISGCLNWQKPLPAMYSEVLNQSFIFTSFR